MGQKGKLTNTEIFLLLVTGLFIILCAALFITGKQEAHTGFYRITTQHIDPAAGQLPEKININTATVEQLQQLEGIGPVLAQRIMDYRETAGPYLLPEDLLAVEGIGQGILENIRQRITTEEQP